MAAPESLQDIEFCGALEGLREELGLVLDEAAQRKLLAHYRLLVKWNRRMNLTTLRDPQEIAVRHFGESLFLARELGIETGTVLDVGSGAGFPGLPVAAVRRGLQVTLLEAGQRKSVFLREVSREWGNVRVLNERLEAVSGSWDLSVMRAVAVRGTLPALARVSKRAAILLGERGAEEARNSPLFIWEAPVSLPWGQRRLLLKGRRSDPG